MSVDFQSIIDTAYRASEATPLDGQVRLYAFHTPVGVEVVDLEDHLEKHRLNPRRKTGTYRVQSAESFVHYLQKHSLPETEVWADPTSATIVGVVNGHHQSGDGFDNLAGHGDHRVIFTVRPTDAWQAWAKYDGKLHDQATIAEHLEDRAIDIVDPAAADMLELAQTFQATIGVNFESAKSLSSGQRQFEYRETVDARAGRAGRLEIPSHFTIGVAPFEGADRVAVKARFRYRVSDGALRIGYALERPGDVVRLAFQSVVDNVTTGVTELDVPVFTGTSA